MKYFELSPQYNSKLYSSLGVGLLIGVWLLVQTGCAGGPEPVALELEIEEDTTVCDISHFNRIYQHRNHLPNFIIA